MNRRRSIATRSDSYKFTHHRQYPSDTETVYSYFESRLKGAETCFFGLQHILKTHLVGSVVNADQVAYANERVDKHLGPGLFNRAGWDHIVKVHGGKLPVRIKAVPEGTVVPSGNVLMTVQNTGGKPTAWLTNYLETLLMQVWYPTSVATLSRNFKKMLAGWGEKTGAPADWIKFALHDFGFRGVSSVESAGIGGMGHLVNFLGTDTFEAIEDAFDSYGEDMAGFSVPAAEHSTITSWGEENEIAAYRNMLTQFPTGIVAVVSDSYDIINACRLWGTVLKDEVLRREGRLVVRPDSGKPWEVVLEVMNTLWEHFGGTLNDKGFKVLDTHVRVIQGDGVDIESASRVLQALYDAGYSAENVVFGMGGALLQKLNRDTFDFAFKCSYAVVAGKGRNVFKNPRHMPSKGSKRGRLKLIESDGQYQTVDIADLPTFHDELQDVFLNGDLLVDQQFSSIRALAEL